MDKEKEHRLSGGEGEGKDKEEKTREKTRPDSLENEFSLRNRRGRGWWTTKPIKKEVERKEGGGGKRERRDEKQSEGFFHLIGDALYEVLKNIAKNNRDMDIDMEPAGPSVVGDTEDDNKEVEKTHSSTSSDEDFEEEDFESALDGLFSSDAEDTDLFESSRMIDGEKGREEGLSTSTNEFDKVITLADEDEEEMKEETAYEELSESLEEISSDEEGLSKENTLPSDGEVERFLPSDSDSPCTDKDLLDERGEYGMFDRIESHDEFPCEETGTRVDLPEEAPERRMEERKRLQSSIYFKRGGIVIKGEVENIGMKGCFVKTTKVLHEGDISRFALVLSGGESPISIRGRVVWVSYLNPYADFVTLPGMGLEFIDMDKDSKNILAKALLKGLTI